MPESSSTLRAPLQRSTNDQRTVPGSLILPDHFQCARTRTIYAKPHPPETILRLVKGSIYAPLRRRRCSPISKVRASARGEWKAVAGLSQTLPPELVEGMKTKLFQAV